MLRRKPKWEVAVRSTRAATRPIRARITKRDRVDVERGRTLHASVVLVRPRRRFSQVHAGDLLEIRYRGLLISALPIRSVTWQVADRRLTLQSETRWF